MLDDDPYCPDEKEMVDGCAGNGARVDTSPAFRYMTPFVIDYHYADTSQNTLEDTIHQLYV